jgi:hypothetical protein
MVSDSTSAGATWCLSYWDNETRVYLPSYRLTVLFGVEAVAFFETQSLARF